MKHYNKPDGSVWAFEEDGSQDHLITPDMTACEQPVPAPHVPTKAERITAVLQTSGIPDLTRREVQAIIAIAELNAKLELAVNGTPIEDTLAETTERNSSYRVARHLEDLCRDIDRS